MAGFQLPGPLCTLLRDLIWIDLGTMCRYLSPPPGTVSSTHALQKAKKLDATGVVVVSKAIVPGAVAATNDVTLSSPNGFDPALGDGVTVNCTFFVDGMASQAS